MKLQGKKSEIPWSSWVFPTLSLLLYLAASALGIGGTFDSSPLGLTFAVLLLPLLFGTVFAAVHHAETIAHRTGEPYGTIVLSLAITFIEVALITSVMLSEEGGSPTLARDTVFSVVMIVCTGLVGLCILVGGIRYGEQSVLTTGASSYLVVLIVLATLSLVLPNFTISGQGQAYDARQLAFVSIVTLVLYGVFLYIQTTLHRDYFVSLGDEEETGQTHVPSNRIVGFSVVLLLFALLAVVLLAKKFAAVVEVGRTALELPVAVTGVVVAFLILLPEGVAAVHAAKRDDLQKALNLAMGSSLATIGLTIPAVACVTIVLGKSLTLGLGSVDTILLVLVLLTSTLTFGQGRTNVLYGFVHLVIFATFLFLTAFP